MNKNDYYANKIAYALDKIQYSLGRMGHKGLKKNALATLYYILAERGSADLGTLMQSAKMSRDEVALALRKLKELGLADWEGKHINSKKSIVALKPSEKPDFAVWYTDLMAKLKQTDLYKDDGEKKQSSHDEETIEVELDAGMTLKITKAKLRQLVLNGLKV